VPTNASTGSAAHTIVFYDGACGMCHGFVRFLVKRDRSGETFLFSPLQGNLIGQLLDDATRATLPDSLILRTPEGRLSARSEAVLGSLERLGGFWGFAASAGRIVPLRVRDGVYDGVARARRRLFGAPPSMCPLVPAHLRDRFVE